MSIRYRLKRSSGPVHEPIPAHPDAIYRPQHRPIPTNIPSPDSDAISERLMDSNPVVAAPLAAGGSGFSPWWIIGPLLALLAVLALAALVYAMKKRHDSKKQAEEENDPAKRETNGRKTNKNEEENPENDDNMRKLSVENVPLRSMKSDTITKEQKRTAPMSSTAKATSISGTDPFLFNKVSSEQFDKSALPVHGLSLTNGGSTLSSTSHPSVNMTRMTKPNSDVFKQSNEKSTSKTAQDAIVGSLLNSPLKNIRSVPTDKIELNYSGNLPPTPTIRPTSSTLSTAQKLGQSSDRLDSNTGKRKSDASLTKKGNQSNDLKQVPDDISPYGQSSTNLGRANHTAPLKEGENNKESPLTASRSGINDLDVSKLKSDANLNKGENQPNGSKRAPNDKSIFGQSLANLGHVDHGGPLTAGEKNKQSSIPSSRSRINDLNTSKVKSDANSSEKENQLDVFKEVYDNKPPFGQSLTNLGRTDHTGPLTAGENNKESPVASSRSGINDSNVSKLKSDASFNKRENQPNGSKKAHDDKSPSGHSLTKLGRSDHAGSSQAGENNKESTLPSSHSEINDLNASRLKLNADSSKKENQSNDFKKAYDDKPPFGQSLTNLGRADHTGSLKEGENNKEPPVPSSHSGVNDLNAATTPGGGPINEPKSPEQHGIGKSPLISDIPTGSKRRGKGKFQSQIDPTEEEKSSSNPSSSSSNLQKRHSSEDSSPSNINKAKHASTLTTHSKHDPLSELSETTSSNSVSSAESPYEKNSTSSRPIYSDEKSNKHNVQPSDQYSMLNKNDPDKFGSRHIQSMTKGLDSNPSDNRLQSHMDSSNSQKSNKPNDDKSDESNASLTQSDLANRNKSISLLPNVPQCKTNTSSDDDDYDEIYPFPSTNSPVQQTTSKRPTTNKPPSNLNLNASTYRKNRTLSMRKFLTKRFRLKDKTFHFDTNDHQ